MNKASLLDKCMERDKLQENIKEQEKETEAFSRSCQEMYDNEIANVSCINYYFKYKIINY